MFFDYNMTSTKAASISSDLPQWLLQVDYARYVSDVIYLPPDSTDLKASINIDLTRRIGQVNPNLRAGFIEHLGRCIYGGILPVESTSPELITPSGFRSDVLSILRDELQIPLMRWPGGNYVS